MDSTEPFLGGWTGETGQLTISGPVLSEGGLYYFGIEIFGIDNVRNIFYLKMPQDLILISALEMYLSQI